MVAFTERVVQLLKSIPVGKVSSYGRIAEMAGNPRGARQVARILHSMSEKHHLPWHRVVMGSGKLPDLPEESCLKQQMLLESEGVFISRGHVDFETYLWSMDTTIDEKERNLET